MTLSARTGPWSLLSDRGRLPLRSGWQIVALSLPAAWIGCLLTRAGLAAAQWLLVLALVLLAAGVLGFALACAALTSQQRRYGRQALGVAQLARAAARSAHGRFTAVSILAAGLAALLAAVLLFLAPGRSLIAAPVSMALTLAGWALVINWRGHDARGAIERLVSATAMETAMRSIPLAARPEPGWSFAARVALLARLVACDPWQNRSAQEAMNALEGLPVARLDPTPRGPDLADEAVLRVRTLGPVLLWSLPAAALAWLLAAAVPPGAVLRLPPPGALLSWPETAPEVPPEPASAPELNEEAAPSSAAQREDGTTDADRGHGGGDPGTGDGRAGPSGDGAPGEPSQSEGGTGTGDVAGGTTGAPEGGAEGDGADDRAGAGAGENGSEGTEAGSERGEGGAADSPAEGDGTAEDSRVPGADADGSDPTDTADAASGPETAEPAPEEPAGGPAASVEAPSTDRAADGEGPNEGNADAPTDGGASDRAPEAVAGEAAEAGKGSPEYGGQAGEDATMQREPSAGAPKTGPVILSDDPSETDTAGKPQNGDLIDGPKAEAPLSDAPLPLPPNGGDPLPAEGLDVGSPSNPFAPPGEAPPPVVLPFPEPEGAPPPPVTPPAPRQTLPAWIEDLLR